MGTGIGVGVWFASQENETTTIQPTTIQPTTTAITIQSTTTAMTSTSLTPTMTTSKITTSTAGVAEKDVLVLSTYRGERQPMIISFDGELELYKQQQENYSNLTVYLGDHRQASFEYGENTEIYYSCSVEYENEFYVFGGHDIMKQVNKYN